MIKKTKNYRMKTITLSLLLASNIFLGQNLIGIVQKNINRGIIYKNDHTTIEGKITTPLSAYQKYIKIRSAGENLNIESKEIDSIVYNEYPNTAILFTSTVYYPKRKSTHKKIKRKEWIKKIIHGKLSLYETTYIEHRKEYSKSNTYYFLKRDNENYPTLIGTRTNEPFPNTNERAFKNNIEKYFSDEPDFLKQIKQKEYSLNELRLICKEYNQ